MIAVIQRAAEGGVTVDGEVVGRIGRGLVVLLGAAEGDTGEDARLLAEKTANLRIFADDQGKMNLSVRDIGGGVLVVSQFTLCADCRKGRRPSFARAAAPGPAEALYEDYCAALRETGLPVETGVFGAMMRLVIHNDGPVTIVLDSLQLRRPRGGDRGDPQ